MHSMKSRVDNVSEWLRSMTRNHMGFARTGSNPVVVETFLNFLFILMNALLVLIACICLSGLKAIEVITVKSFGIMHFLKFRILQIALRVLHSTERVWVIFPHPQANRHLNCYVCIS